MSITKTIQEAVNDLLEEFVKQEENHTLEELKQKLINELFKIPVLNYGTTEVEILKILFN